MLNREYLYIFFVDGVVVEQNSFPSDKMAVDHASKIEGRKSKPCYVARFLERNSVYISLDGEGLTPLARKEVQELILEAVSRGLS